MKIWGESHFLVISHWTSYATKYEPVYEKKTLSPATSRMSQAGLEVTKDSITLDNYDPQSLEFAQQLGTGPFLMRIDQFSKRWLRT